MYELDYIAGAKWEQCAVYCQSDANKATATNVQSYEQIYGNFSVDSRRVRSCNLSGN